MTMYLYTFLAVPTEEAEEFEEAGGAYVDCWIQGDDQQRAQARAEELIRDYGWEVQSLEEGAIVTSDSYDEDDEDREFYEQALVEGEVLVFNTWPPGEEPPAEDGDELN